MKAGARWLAVAGVAALAVGVAQWPAQVSGLGDGGVVHVASNAAAGGDGSRLRPVNNLPDAVALARASRGSVPKILLSPGRYELSQPLLIDFAVEIRGSNKMIRGADGWPTGNVHSGTDTVIVGSATFGTGDLVQIGREAGPVITGPVTVQDLTFDLGGGNGPTASVLHLVKVRNFAVRRNRFVESNANIGILTVASSGRITENFISGVGCGMCIDAGTRSAPSNVEIVGNRAVRNRFGGILLDGTGWLIPETDADQLTADVRHNDLSENTFTPQFSFGIRIFVVRRDVGLPGDTQYTGNVTAKVSRNRMVGNEIGMTVDAGFPFRQYAPCPGCPPQCDNRVYTGSVNLTLADNELRGSLLTPGLVSFTRNTAALAPGTMTSWQYLHGGRFTIRDPDRSLAGYWLEHPAADPVVDGFCGADATAEPLGNRLVYNGSVVPNGRTIP